MRGKERPGWRCCRFVELVFRRSLLAEREEKGEQKCWSVYTLLFHNFARFAVPCLLVFLEVNVSFSQGCDDVISSVSYT